MRYGLELIERAEFPLFITLPVNGEVTEHPWKQLTAGNVSAEEMLHLIHFLGDSDTIDELDNKFVITEYKDHAYDKPLLRMTPSQFLILQKKELTEDDRYEILGMLVENHPVGRP